jgi:DNA-binding NarL/FixJ family response regulator
MYTAIIADDDTIQCTIIKKIIADNYTRIDIIAEVGTAQELIIASNKHKPHLLLLDITQNNNKLTIICDEDIDLPDIIIKI